MPNSIILAGDFVPRADLAPYDPFSDDVKELFQGSKYVIINLETPLTERGKPILKTGKNFRRSPKYAEILKKAGVDCVCLANNHIRDYGDEGVLDTIRYCKEAGLDVVGAGFNSEDAAKPLIKELGGLRVGFLNYCEREFSIADKNQAGANPFDLIEAYHAIQYLRSEVDKIIVVYHGGIEYQHYPTPEMVKYFRFLVDIGADTVLAHHAHAYSGYECYKGKMIYYGLGNLVSFTSARKPDESWFVGIAAKLSIVPNSSESELITLNQALDFSKVSVASQELRTRVEDQICEINKTISDPILFATYWEDRYSAYRQTLYRHLLIPNQGVRKIAKKTGIHLKMPIRYRMEVLNLFRCDAHRNKAISLLSSDTCEVHGGRQET
jgi:poly-gamma-glutamate synthesis protein (capsule biosynthesis protein)